MTPSPSRAFRRWCAATIALVLSWSLQGSALARVSPIEVVKYQLRKPNFLIMVESAESMQGIPGENATRFNEVGADCQNGDRFCRLYGQAGRCEFSGMGSQGYVFDAVSAGTASRTDTQSDTLVTSTTTVTQTGTASRSEYATVAMTSTSTTPSGGTGSEIGTATITATGTQTAYATGTLTGSETYNTTSTVTASSSNYSTSTVTGSSSNYSTSTVTASSSNYSTSTVTGSSSYYTTSTVTGSVSQNTTASAYSTAQTTGDAVGASPHIVGYWGLDDANPFTTVVDDSGNQNNGTGVGVSATTGQFGGAAQFQTATSTNATKYIDLPSAMGFPTATTTALTVAVLLNPAVVNQRQSVVGYDGGVADGSGFGFRLLLGTSSNNVCMDNNKDTGQICDTAPNQNAWSLIVVSVSGNNWKMYRYGQSPSNCSSPASTKTGSIASTAFNSGGKWHLGASGTNRKYGYNGKLDEMRIWSVALTDTSQFNSICSCGGLSCPAPTGTVTTTKTMTSLPTVTRMSTNTQSVSQTTANTGTLTTTASVSAATTNTGTLTTTQSKSAATTNTGTLTTTQSKSAATTNTGTLTTTESKSAATTNTGTLSATASRSVSTTNTGTTTDTKSVLGTPTGTGTVTQTATAPSIVSIPDFTTNTESLTETQTLTGTVTTTSLLKPAPDLDDCTPASCSGTSSYCYLNRSVACTLDSTCTALTKGDFCRVLNTSDRTGRGKNDFCVLPNPNPSGKTTCRYQQAATCSSNSDCNGGVGDYCVSGTPARMCQKSGLWCADDDTGCDSSSGDACVPATSRLMMVKNAVRRVMLEHAYDDTAVVKMGQMHTFQAGLSGDPNNPSLDPASLFPYVQLDDVNHQVSTRTEVKFLPRSELVKGIQDSKPCFSESDGPSSSCIIDYGAGGVTYTRIGGNDSRYAVPNVDGKTYSRVDSDWSTNKMLGSFDGGKGLYEGSYYTFEYKWGVPVASGPGSVRHPQYYDTYHGKSFGSIGSYWYLMDAERSEKVNENKYGAREFTGPTWSRDAEYPIPLVGASGDPTSTSLTCSASNGAQWDYSVVPMLNDPDVQPVRKALMNAARLEKASFGGFYATGSIEPVACALKNDNPNDNNSHHTVDGYMAAVKLRDGTPCWENHVLLVVDGLPRGPGDVGGVDCSADACMYDPDTSPSHASTYNPNLTGCNCPAVAKARALAIAGVNVHVIAATTDLKSRNEYAAKTLNNIARAGSTRTNFINIPRYAVSEDELYYWLNYEMKEALRVTVATTPASAASGAQSLEGVTAGNRLFQTTVELPEWRGNLVGFSISSATATQTVTRATTSGQTATATATTVTYSTGAVWDAASVNKFTVRSGSPPSDAEQQLWMKRRVFFSDGLGHVQRISRDDGTVDSGVNTTLRGLGMGGNVDETQRIVQWMLGKIDPSDSDHKPLNPAVMGSVLNSVPIDVGPPGASTMPGGNHFWQSHATRAELVYLGADDGMLHAFRALDGVEAFAFIPGDMVRVIAKLYAQGGQRYSPNDHVYGLAGSPKVKNLCVANCKVATGLTCSDEPNGIYQEGCPDWRTILVMSEGPGGNHPFALDITDPVPSGIATLTDASLLWYVGDNESGPGHVGSKNASGISIAHLGETDSVPAFTYHKTADQNDYRVLMASGYPYPSESSTTTQLIEATAWAGAAPGGSETVTPIDGSGGCNSSTGQEFAVLADVAVARDYSVTGDQNLLAAYVADTWGTVHQYAPGYSPVLRDAISLGCGHPLHFSPAVVQLNRNNPNNEGGNSVYLVQVSNSILDPNTVTYSADKFPASKLVVAKLSPIGNSPPGLDENFGSGGLIQLSADASSEANRLCGVTTVKTSAATGCGSGGSWLPTDARPTGTPVAVLRSDGSGFQIFTTWYTPPAANWDNCPGSSTNGNSYVTLHEFLSNGTWAQIAGVAIQHQYVTGVQFVGTALFVTYGDGSSPAPPAGWDNFGQTFVSVDKVLQSMSGDRFVKTAWTERLDAE